MYSKKLKSLRAVILLINYALIIPNIKVSADEIKRNHDKYNSNAESVFLKAVEKYKNINRKIEEEIESHTDLLYEDMESYLDWSYTYTYKYK